MGTSPAWLLAELLEASGAEEGLPLALHPGEVAGLGIWIIISLHGTTIKVQSVWGCHISGGMGAWGWGRPCSSLSPYGEDTGSLPQQRGHRLTLSRCGGRGGSDAPAAVGLRSGRQARQFGPRTVEEQVLGRLPALGVVAPPRSRSPSPVTLSSPSRLFTSFVMSSLSDYTSPLTPTCLHRHTHT